jgi:hypothetical protein
MVSWLLTAIKPESGPLTQSNFAKETLRHRCEVVAFVRVQRSPGLSMAPKLYRQRQESAIYRAKLESSGECRFITGADGMEPLALRGSIDGD